MGRQEATEYDCGGDGKADCFEIGDAVEEDGGSGKKRPAVDAAAHSSPSNEEGHVVLFFCEMAPDKGPTPP